MNKLSATEKRVTIYLERMKKAMPEVKRQIAVYEKAAKEGTLVKNPKPAPQFKHG